MNLDQTILELTAPAPDRETAKQILRKSLTLANHELTDDDDAEPQVRRILSAILHRDLTQSDVNEALEHTAAIQDLRIGVNLDWHIDNPDSRDEWDACLESHIDQLNAVVNEMTYGLRHAKPEKDMK